MDKKTYYLKLQELVDKVRDLKKEVEDSNDKEKIGYLKLAIESVYEEIRQLMENNK
jgi:hypothetical protein